MPVWSLCAPAQPRIDCSESCVLVEPDPVSRVLKRKNQGVIVTGCLQNRLCRDSVKVSVEIVRGFSVARSSCYGRWTCKIPRSECFESTSRILGIWLRMHPPRFYRSVLNDAGAAEAFRQRYSQMSRPESRSGCLARMGTNVQAGGSSNGVGVVAGLRDWQKA